MFLGGRLFESHPLTILNAPAPASNISSRTLTLGSRVVGDWSRALHAYALREKDLILSVMETEKPRDDQTVGVPVRVMIDGPYADVALTWGSTKACCCSVEDLVLRLHLGFWVISLEELQGWGGGWGEDEKD